MTETIGIFIHFSYWENYKKLYNKIDSYILLWQKEGKQEKKTVEVEGWNIMKKITKNYLTEISNP